MAPVSSKMNAMSPSNMDGLDSPSRQLLHEMKRLHLAQQDQFLKQLDRDNEERETEHKQALAAAAEQHERVRQSVELERRRLEAQIQAERDRRDAENRRELEKQRREKAERDLEEKRREVERQKTIESERNRDADLERQRMQAIEQSRARAAQEKEAAAKRDQQREDLAAQQRIQPQRPPVLDSKPTTSLSPQANGIIQASTTPQKPPPTNLASSYQQPAQPSIAPTDPRTEAEHNEFLAIHRRLKDMRKFVAAEGKKNPSLKEKCRALRQTMRTAVGQLIEGKGQNKQPLQKIINSLKDAASTTSPVIPVAPFLTEQPPNVPPGAEGPALLIYGLNMFAKTVLTQWINEAGASPKAADPVGIVASHIFALDAFLWHGQSLISILLAKLHRTCPVLFGIYGPENTEAGKRRLGWWEDETGWLSRQRHYERMTGLASGFAAISLRNYEKARVQNPYPEHHYWTALARIANTPTSALTQTHFVVLKGMVEHYQAKFIGFYGEAAVAALRVVLIDLPNRIPEEQRGGVAIKGIQALVEVLKRDSKLVL